MDLVSINDGASFLGDVYDFTFAGIERHVGHINGANCA
jgi:hypothetical protein